MELETERLRRRLKQQNQEIEELRQRQDEVLGDLFSTPRWPNIKYIRNILAIYAAWCVFTGSFFFIGAAIYSFPFAFLTFVVGAVFVYISLRTWRSDGRYLLTRILSLNYTVRH